MIRIQFYFILFDVNIAYITLQNKTYIYDNIIEYLVFKTSVGCIIEMKKKKKNVTNKYQQSRKKYLIINRKPA